jgi:hypothetical protein
MIQEALSPKDKNKSNKRASKILIWFREFYSKLNSEQLASSRLILDNNTQQNTWKHVRSLAISTLYLHICLHSWDVPEISRLKFISSLKISMTDEKGCEKHLSSL